jgi:hypothetical protein
MGYPGLSVGTTWEKIVMSAPKDIEDTTEVILELLRRYGHGDVPIKIYFMFLPMRTPTKISHGIRWDASGSSLSGP